LGSLSFGSSTSTVGLDIGTDHVRAVQLRPAGDGFALTAYGVVEMPMGAVVEGEIVDIDAVTSAIKEVWRRSGVRGKDVSIGVSNQKVIVRLIDLPFMEHAELAGAIQYQAQDYIPMAIEESILDFQIIGDYMTPSDEHMMEVLLVAAHREMIGASVAAVEGAGLKLSQIDVSSFAIVRAHGYHPCLLGDHEHRRCRTRYPPVQQDLVARRQPVHAGDRERPQPHIR
jgi:type IV pilus assembly protein PilM